MRRCPCLIAEFLDLIVTFAAMIAQLPLRAKLGTPLRPKSMATTDLATPGGTLDAQTLIGSSNPQTPQFSHIQLCAVFLSKPDCFFIIKVAPDDNVYECQRMVKGENENHCVNVDAGDILLWKVCQHLQSYFTMLTAFFLSTTAEGTDPMPRCKPQSPEPSE
jgi:hypothetical protein